MDQQPRKIVKKFINNKEDCVNEELEGLCLLNPNIKLIKGTQIIVTKEINKNKVNLICGGGSGHEPAHAGFVCNSMLSAAVCGRVFASPPTEEVLEAIEQVNSDKGVLIIIKNYTGDVINFNLAMTIARSKGIKVESLIVGDDIAIDPEKPGRGLTGTVLIYKLLSAYSLMEPTPSLQQVKQLGEELLQDIESLGISLQPCALPGETLNKTLEFDEMELGLGIHNELGKSKLKLKPINEIISLMLNEFLLIFRDLKQCAVLVNNLGATTQLEMLIIQKEILIQLKRKGIQVLRVISGELLTSLETHGFIITLFKLNNADSNKTNLLLKLLDYPIENQNWQKFIPNQDIDSIYQSQISLSNKEEKNQQQYSEEAKLLIKKLENIFQELKKNEQKLNQLDAATGDGDMGTGVASSSAALLQLLKENILPFDSDLKNSIQQIGQIVSKSFGGTSGALYSAFLYAASSQFDSQLQNTNFHQFINAIYEGMKAIKEVGVTQIGDRTMIDSLEPAVLIGKEAETNGSNSKEIIKIMLESAMNGALKAAQLPAKKGRSFYLQGQEIGQKDPGCELIVLLISLIDKYFF